MKWQLRNSNKYPKLIVFFQMISVENTSINMALLKAKKIKLTWMNFLKTCSVAKLVLHSMILKICLTISLDSFKVQKLIVNSSVRCLKIWAKVTGKSLKAELEQEKREKCLRVWVLCQEWRI